MAMCVDKSWRHNLPLQSITFAPVGAESFVPIFAILLPWINRSVFLRGTTLSSLDRVMTVPPWRRIDDVAIFRDEANQQSEIFLFVEMQEDKGLIKRSILELYISNSIQALLKEISPREH